MIWPTYFERDQAVEEENSLSVRGRIAAADHPIFAGHFDGRPVLPAIAQLVLIESGCRQLLGSECTISRIGNVKFRRPVVPDDEIEIGVHRSDEQSAKFELRVAGEVGTAGGVSCSTSSAPRPSGAGPDRAADEKEAEDGIGSWLPHTDTALFAERSIGPTENSTTVWGAIPAAHPLSHDGLASSILLLELAAQAIAGVPALGSEKGRIGFIAAMRGVELNLPLVETDRNLRVDLELTRSAGPISMFSSRVFHADAVDDGALAVANITTAVTD